MESRDVARNRDAEANTLATPPVSAAEVPPRKVASSYPPEFARRMGGREKRALGDHFGLRNFGVNFTRLEPGAVSALQHRHSRQDEFIYVLEGGITLVSGAEEHVLTPGMCAGFPAGGASHHLENRGDRPALYLEVGDRSAGDEVTYPFDDLAAHRTENGWRFTRKNGAPC
ncbi:MAG TPA: cupin domain-containing protein [Sphingomonadales bacterium]